MNDHLRSRLLLNQAYNFACYLRLPCCQGGDAGEPAHSNQSKHGKGGSIKAHDCFFVPACRACHVEFDQGRTMDREEKAALFDRAYGEFAPLLWRAMGDGK